MTVVDGVLLFVVVVLVVAMVTLLTERSRRTRAELALRESEERFHHMADHAPVMIWSARPDTTLDFVNHTCVEFTGLPFEQLVSEGWMDAVHPEDLDDCVATYVPAIEARTPFVVEYRLRRADGAFRWILDTGFPKYEFDGSFTGYIGCCVDITERKDAEDQNRESGAALEASHREIRLLAGRLIAAQDAERARLARDLHDEVSQQLAGLSIALSSLRHRMDDQGVSNSLQVDVRALHQRTSTLAQNVRHLSHDLHPTVLRHGGLEAALTSYCADLERAGGPVLTCSAEGDFVTLSPAGALCLYRTAQEALRNVVAHAGASRAEVRLILIGDTAKMTIVDDGHGFDVARSFEHGNGLGLISIMERVRLAGGTASVVAESNKGTRVSVQIPAHSPMETETATAAVNGGVR
jgi:PAS domain S-box-containing protein